MKCLFFILCFSFYCTSLHVVAQDSIIYTAKRNSFYKGQVFPSAVYVDKDPEFLGGERVLNSFFKEHLVYPDSVNRNKLDGGDHVLLKFIVTDQGVIKNISVLKSLHPAYDAEAVRVMQLLRLLPGEKNGLPVSSEMIYPVVFRDLKAVMIVDQMPRYPGGVEAMMSFIKRNLKYPVKAQRSGIEGRVVVRFVVSKNGKVRDAEVITGIDSECDAEAVRVILSMPKWEPGILDGRPVPVYFNLPLQFKLPEQKPFNIFQNNMSPRL